MLGKYLTLASALSVIGVVALPRMEDIQSLISMSDTRMPPINVPTDSTLTLEVFKWDTNTMLFTPDDYKMEMRLSQTLNRISQVTTVTPPNWGSVVVSAYSEDDNAHVAISYEAGEPCQTYQINNPDVKDQIAEVLAEVDEIIYLGFTACPWDGVQYHQITNGDSVYFITEDGNLKYNTDGFFDYPDNTIQRVYNYGNGLVSTEFTPKDFEIMECNADLTQ